MHESVKKNLTKINIGTDKNICKGSYLITLITGNY